MNSTNTNSSIQSLRTQLSNITWKQPVLAILSSIFILILVLIGDVAPDNVVGIRAIFPASSVQVLAGIWLGFWGLPACFIGGFTFQLVNGQSLLSATLIGFSDLWMGLLPALFFRYLKINYDLSTVRDWILYLLGIILLTPIPSAVTGVTILILVNELSWTLFWLSVGYWILGNYFVNSLVVTLALMLLSPKLTNKDFIISGLFG